MKRAEKVKTITRLLSGEITMQEVSRQTVFLSYKQSDEEPAFFYDENQQALTQAEVSAIQQKTAGAYLVWNEIRVYETKSSLLKSY